MSIMIYLKYIYDEKTRRNKINNIFTNFLNKTSSMDRSQQVFIFWDRGNSTKWSTAPACSSSQKEEEEKIARIGKAAGVANKRRRGQRRHSTPLNTTPHHQHNSLRAKIKPTTQYGADYILPKSTGRTQRRRQQQPRQGTHDFPFHPSNWGWPALRSLPFLKLFLLLS
jgi:hypothetical protein